MRRIFTVLLLLTGGSGFAQKETSNWFLFQTHTAVTPAGVTTELPGPNYNDFNPLLNSTSLSDANGNLLFANDGNTIIDKDFAVMPALKDVFFRAQYGRMLIQQLPGTKQYFVFYTAANNSTANSPYTLRYAVVDLALRNGSGDVTVYNQVVDSTLSPGYTLVQEKDGGDAWLVTHRSATDSFLLYKITSAGIANTPVVRRAGVDPQKQDYIFKELKPSHDGKMLAGIAYRDYTTIFSASKQFTEVFTFDFTTGAIASKVRTQIDGGYFEAYKSVEFSPDNRLLYTGFMGSVYGLQPCGWGSGNVRQYNLCYTDSATFNFYAMNIANRFDWCNPGVSWGNIQMGADKRIHMPFSGTAVSTINYPNRVGTSARYVFDSYDLPTVNNGFKVTPGFHHKVLEKAIKNNIVYNGGCFPKPLTFSITNDTINNIRWNFGDPAGSNNTSTLKAPSHVFSAPGGYTVTAQLYSSFNVLIETITEQVEVKDPGKKLLAGYPLDTVLCSGSSSVVGLTAVNALFHWYQLAPGKIEYNTVIGDSIYISNSGKWYVEMRQNDCDGCVMLDSINVTILPSPNFSLGPDKTFCSGDTLELSINAPGAGYVWNTGQTTSSIKAYQPGVYWVQAEYNHNGCPQRDSILLTQYPGLNFKLPADTTLCNDQTLLLNPGVTNAWYQWQDGSGDTSFTVEQPGTYWVRLTLPNGCFASDTVHVNYISAQQVYLGNDTSLCTGSTLKLTANTPGAQYYWSTGAVSPTLTINQTGNYWVRINNGSCTVTDSISVVFTTPPFLNLGADTTLCANDRLLLQPGITNANYTWQNGSANNSFVVTAAGKYYVQVKQNGCVVNDTITIGYYAVPPLTLGPDVQFCAGNTATLQAAGGFKSYLWSTGATSPSIQVSTAGNYFVAGSTADGCKAYDTVQVLTPHPRPVVQLNHNPSICVGESRLLDASGNFASWLWNDGSTATTKTIQGTGMHSVRVTDSKGCQGSDTVVITSILPLPAHFLPADTAICAYGSLDLAPVQTYSSYLWNTNATTARISIVQPGVYILQVTDRNNCKGKDSINVLQKECMTGLFVPSAFTPNNDGLNDYLQAFLFGDIKKFEFKLYNRFGETVFQTNTPYNKWNGKVNGLDQNAGVFVWTCHYKLGSEPEKLEKGTIVLMR